MDIGELIGNAPELVGKLQEIGLDDNGISNLGSGLGEQLTGGGFDLGNLDIGSMLENVDIDALADKVGISPDMVRSAVGLISSHLGGGEGAGGGALGAVAGLAKGLFGKK